MSSVTMTQTIPAARLAHSPADVVPVQIGSLRQLLLRDLHFLTKLADPEANCCRKVAPDLAGLWPLCGIAP